MTQNKRVTWALGALLLAAWAPSQAAPPAAEAPLAAGVPVLNSGVAEVKPGEAWLMYEIGGDIHLARPDGSDQRLLMQERVVPGPTTVMAIGRRTVHGWLSRWRRTTPRCGSWTLMGTRPSR